MPRISFQANIENFAGLLLAQPDSVLGKKWGWGSYESEGVRFGILRIIEMLVEYNARVRGGKPDVETARYLADYREAYWDLQSVLTGLSDMDAGRAPVQGEWDVRTTLAHILGGELGFQGVMQFALEHHRAGTWSEISKITEDDWDRLLDLTEEQYEVLMAGTLSMLRQEHRRRHEEILGVFDTLTTNELDLPSKYWEAETYPLRFRLGRFASHLRQHTVQIEKTLTALDIRTSENRMLVRHLYRAFAALPLEGLSSADEDVIAGVITQVREAVEAA